MGMCELCGKGAPLIRASVEGTDLEVCAGCRAFGKVAPSPGKRMPLKTAIAAPELEMNEQIDANVAALIRSQRERRSLTQEEFARFLSEKESTIHKIETGILEPSIPLARKLEKMLKIRLVRAVKEDAVENKYVGPAKMTIGDIIKVK